MVSLHAALALMALSGTNQTVLLDFYSDSCPPCRAMDPVVKQLAAQGYPIRQVNIEHDRALAAQFRIQRIPCFVMIVDGREVERTEGLTSPQRLAQMCRAGMPAARSPAMLAGAATAPRTGTAAIETGQFCPVGPQTAPAPAGLAPVPPANPRPVVAGGRVKADEELIAVSARLRIEDSHGWSCGSGTIIDSRSGEALILTCGHIFRESKGQGRVEVDLFGVNAMERIPGNVVSYDLDRDVGLVSIRVPRPLAAAQVAPLGYQLRPGDAIVTVGCNNGSAPDVRRSRVTTVNRYAGAPNLEVADLPVQGRSGGGLFTPDGLVAGVCNAADPPQEGLYAALASIHDEFKHAGIDDLFRMPGESAPPVAVAAAPGPIAPAPGAADSPPLARQLPRPGDLVPVSAREPSPAAEPARLPAEEQALLDEIHRRAAEGAEVIFIVRPRNNPQASSEILMLERASATLLEKLAAEARAGTLRTEALPSAGALLR